MPAASLVLATDIDGTLLDDAGAWPAPPRVLRARLAQITGDDHRPVTLAMASSRTLDELLALQRWLGWPGPCLAEDGAVVAVDADAAGTMRRALRAVGVDEPELRVAGRRRLFVVQLGSPADRLRELLRAWPGFRAADLARADVSRLRALGFSSPGRRRRSLARRHASVLLDPTQWRAIVRSAGEHAPRSADVDIASGGRWSTATQRAGKGAAIAWLRRVIDVNAPAPCRIIGVGNGENDRSMLEACDVRYAVRDDSGLVHPALAEIAEVHIPDSHGTRGWLEMIDQLSAARTRGVE